MQIAKTSSVRYLQNRKINAVFQSPVNHFEFMKRIMKMALLLFLPAMAEAQQSQKTLDSLRFAFGNAGNDSIRMDILSKLGNYYADANQDSAMLYIEEGLALARHLKLKIWEAGLLSFKGYILGNQGNYSRSLESFLQASKIAEDPASEKNSWHLWAGNARNTRLDVLADIRHNMGHIYGAIGNNGKQVSSYLETLPIAELVKDTVLLAEANMNLGNAYRHQAKTDSALYYELTALDFFAKMGSKSHKYEGHALNTMGAIYLQKGMSDSAITYFQRSARISAKENNLSSLGNAFLGLSQAYKTSRSLDSSLTYARQALISFQAVGQKKEIADTYDMLSSIHDGLHHPDSAMLYLKWSKSMNDSLNTTRIREIMDYQNIGFNEQIRIEELEKERVRTQSRYRTFALLTGIGVFMLTAFLLYRNNLNRKRSNDLLQVQKDELQSTLSDLRTTQSQLIQSEKMASLGELTAGIAHEIQNPLNFVNNFSELNKELIQDMKAEIGKGNYDEVKSISKNLEENQEKIHHHGQRADAIVKSMLQHSRNSGGQKELIDLNALADEYLTLSYHGLRAKDKDFNATLQTSFDPSIGMVGIIPQDIGRVLLNLYNNAFNAVTEKNKLGKNGYEPTVSVSTKKMGDKVEIRVKDNGMGIPEKVKEKIFQPFFTTKPTGQGTGLGLSLSYDIIKAHQGTLTVESREGEYTEFIIQLSA
jgi:two-component system NtrC family sensor kinase